MVNLNKLDVSLTKHGAHKLALLLLKYDKDRILDRLWDKEPGINIDLAQAKKNLSASPRGVVPHIWNDVRALGHRSINALVLIGIVFSHHDLMRAMARGRTGPYRGTVKRGDVLDEKAYTNFAHTVHELGFSPRHTTEYVRYNLEPMFSIAGLGPLALDLLKLKLKTAGWDGLTDPIAEMVSHRFPESLAISPVQFRNWLRLGAAEGSAGDAKDAAFFSGADEVPTKPFEFRPGHKPRKTSPVALPPGDSGSREATVPEHVKPRFRSM